MVKDTAMDQGSENENTDSVGVILYEQLDSLICASFLWRSVPKFQVQPFQYLGQFMRLIIYGESVCGTADARC